MTGNQFQNMQFWLQIRCAFFFLLLLFCFRCSTCSDVWQVVISHCVFSLHVGVVLVCVCYLVHFACVVTSSVRIVGVKICAESHKH